jgi:hypothetical protein
MDPDGTKVSACSSAHGHEPRAMARPGVNDGEARGERLDKDKKPRRVGADL